MGWFSKKTTTCPICQAAIEKGGTLGHWQTHVEAIPPGHGDASGQFTWNCTCGPAGLKWPTDGAAAAGLTLHMFQRHGISIGDYDNVIRGKVWSRLNPLFLVREERRGHAARMVRLLWHHRCQWEGFR